MPRPDDEERATPITRNLRRYAVSLIPSGITPELAGRAYNFGNIQFLDESRAIGAPVQ